MDDETDFADLEAELRELSPAAPPAHLERLLAAQLDQPVPKPAYRTATTWTSWKWANWGVAAALVGLMAWFSWRTPEADVSMENAPLATLTGLGLEVSETMERGGIVYRPVSAERLLLGSRVDGVVRLADGTAAERVRDYFIDTVTWRATAGKGELQVNVPREAVRFVGLAAN